MVSDVWFAFSYFVTCDFAVCCLLSAQVSKTGGVREIKQAIAEAAGVDEEVLAVGEIEKDWQEKIITDMTLLKKGTKVSWLPSRRGAQLVAYEPESRPR